MNHISTDAGGPVRRLTWSLSEVCDALGISEETFRRHRSALEAKGFPRRLPYLPGYSIAAVTDWIAHCGGDYQPFVERRPAMTGEVPPLTFPLRREADALEAAYGDEG